LTDRTDQLIADLVHELLPVRRLPPLWKVAATALALAAGIVVFARSMAALAGQMPLKGSPHVFDFLGLAGQWSVAGGAFAIALAACVPGRDSLRAAGLWVCAAGALLWLMGTVTMLGAERAELLSGAVLRDTALCTLNSLVPALVLALPLRRFVDLATPRHRNRVLFAGVFAAASFSCAPVNLACAQSGVVHGLMAHLLAPLLSAGVAFALIRLLDSRMPGVTGAAWPRMGSGSAG
jgi:hypothetical protein